MIPQQARVFVLPNLLQITSTLTNVHTNGCMDGVSENGFLW